MQMFHTTPSRLDVRVHALASGSSGNAMLVQAGDTFVLIDAGIGVRSLAAMLAKRGLIGGRLDAILLTHEHTDHSIGAGPLSRRTGAPIVANSGTLAAYGSREELAFDTLVLATGSEITVGPMGVRSFAVPHDAVEAVGYVLECGDTRIAYFTDAGSCTPAMKAALDGVNLAIVESNHDIEWLMRGPYTPQMKERVASPTGHLSNGDCADLLAARLDCGGPMSIWLAHLSRVNNSPALARRSVRERIASQTRVPFHLDIALRDQPSVSWRSGAQAVQLNLL